MKKCLEEVCCEKGGANLARNEKKQEPKTGPKEIKGHQQLK